MRRAFSIAAIVAVAFVVPSLFGAVTHAASAAVIQGRGNPPTPPPTPPPNKPPTPPGKPTTTSTPKGPMTVSQHLAAQPHLVARVQPLLPPGTDLNLASAGFKTLGSFISAVHVSHNLDIPFNDLKLKLTGTTPESLGQAIHELKPTVNSAEAVKTAEDQAKKDLADKGGTPSKG